MEKEIQAYYDQLAQIYDENRFGNSYGQYIHKQEEHFLKKHLGKGEILSLGCGTGRFMEMAGSGVDMSTEMIREAQRKFPEKHFTVSDAEQTPFEANTFDQIFCLHVFMHLSVEKSIGLIREAKRILVKDGSFVFDFPSEKRRRLLRKKYDNWHGANSWSIEELKKITDQHWNLKVKSGILFLPIHRMPKWSRKFFLKIDFLLCHSFMKEYASYLIVKLEKK